MLIASKLTFVKLNSKVAIYSFATLATTSNAWSKTLVAVKAVLIYVLILIMDQYLCVMQKRVS